MTPERKNTIAQGLDDHALRAHRVVATADPLAAAVYAEASATLHRRAEELRACARLGCTAEIDDAHGHPCPWPDNAYLNDADRGPRASISPAKAPGLMCARKCGRVASICDLCFDCEAREAKACDSANVRPWTAEALALPLPPRIA